MESNIFNNMIQNQNHPTQPGQSSSVFGFDTYPGQSSIYSMCDNYKEHPYSNSVSLQSNFLSSMQLPQIPTPIAPQIPSVFSFGSNPSLGFQTVNMGFPSEQRMRLILGKRKSTSPPPHPCKQHITEEKMAEHMSKLHISSETATSPLEPDSVKNKRLYMCEELRKLQTDSLLPPSLLEQFNKPCTALVLWQPNPRIPKVSSDTSINNNEEDCEEEKDKVKPSSSLNMVCDVGNDLSGSMDLDL